MESEITLIHKALKQTLDETLVDTDVILKFIDRLRRYHSYSILSDYVVNDLASYIVNDNNMDQILDFLSEFNFYLKTNGFTNKAEAIAERYRYFIFSTKVIGDKLEELTNPNSNNDLSMPIYQTVYLLRMCSKFIERYYATINNNRSKGVASE